MKNQDIIDRLRSEMVSRYGVDSAEVRTVRSPYRICPLGAHVDHQVEAVVKVSTDYGTKYPELAKDAPVFLCNSDDGARIF
jgi:hypothetical protein